MECSYLLPRYQVSQCRADQSGTLTLTLTGAHIPAAPSVTKRDHCFYSSNYCRIVVIIIVVIIATISGVRRVF